MLLGFRGTLGHARSLAYKEDSQEVTMKFLVLALTTTLSVAADVPATAKVNAPSNNVLTSGSLVTPSAARPSTLIAGRRRGKCQENLGYGRTGSYGCG
jgi:hypothetical protein